MKVSECMTRNVVCIAPEQTVRDAARLMMEHDTGALVVGSEKDIEGMITDRDIALRVVAKGLGSDTPVHEAMSRGDVVCAYDDQPLDEVAMIMSQSQVRRMPVMSRQLRRLVGVVSLGDLAMSEEAKTSEAALCGIARPGGQHNQARTNGSGLAM